MKQYFEDGTSFCQETTLCGKSILRNIQKAKNLGYSVEMHYVGLDSPDTAKESLKVVLPQCDLAAIYDNTEGFRRFAIYKSGRCMRLSSQIPEWYQGANKVEEYKL